MKCSICKKDACYAIPKYKTAKTQIVDYYDYRCENHLTLGRKKERDIKEKRKNVRSNPNE